MVLPAGEVGFMALAAGGEGGLHGYSPLGERVGCTVTPHWGRRLTACKVNSCFVCSVVALDFV